MDGSLAEIGFDESFSDWAEDWINEAAELAEKDNPRADYIPCTIELKAAGQVIGMNIPGQAAGIHRKHLLPVFMAVTGSSASE